MAAVLVAIEREVVSNMHSGTVVNALSAGEGVARARRDELEKRLERLTIEELKSYLRLNNQLLSGTKVELLRRVADGVFFGALPQCPTCGGHLHPEASSEGDQPLFRCRKLKFDREPCGFEILAENLVRRPFIGADQLS
jgi:tRNA(Ile2) C34 agmatinyltransferase TiaS